MLEPGQSSPASMFMRIKMMMTLSSTLLPWPCKEPPTPMTTPKSPAELVKSVREDYEIQRSGIKPQSAGKTNWQIKANSNKDWASNLNVRSTRPGDSGKMHPNRQGLAALVKINGIEAYMWWDTGSELDTISPDFTQATGIKPKPKESTLRIHLGTKGSSASTSYEVTPILDLGNTRINHMLDVVNLDRWDLLLGNPFCNQYGVVLNYKNCTIHFSNTMINALLHEEEAAAHRGERKLCLHAISTWLGNDNTTLPEPEKPPGPPKPKQMQSGTKPTLKELNAKLEPLCQKWLKEFACICGPPPSKLPPLWAVNHTIQLINSDAQYSLRPPQCSVVVFPLLCEKTQCYIQAGWWKPTHGKNAVPLLTIPKISALQEWNANTVIDSMPSQCCRPL